MNQVLNVKIDPELKKQAQTMAKQIGLPMSTVVAAGLRDFVATGSVTFSTIPGLSPKVEQELLARAASANAGQQLSPKFSNLKSAKAWLEQ